MKPWRTALEVYSILLLCHAVLFATPLPPATRTISDTSTTTATYTTTTRTTLREMVNATTAEENPQPIMSTSSDSAITTSWALAEIPCLVCDRKLGNHTDKERKTCHGHALAAVTVQEKGEGHKPDENDNSHNTPSGRSLRGGG
jgi:hypothetical protein